MQLRGGAQFKSTWSTAHVTSLFSLPPFSTPTASADQRVLDFLSDSLLSRSRELPLWVDAVEKLSDTQRAGNNRIQFPHSLNQCCAPASYLESMLLTRASKNLFRQHRSVVDIPHAD
jgi:hypothetical protein